MNEFTTGAVRDTGGKGRMDLIPWCAIIRVSKHMEDAIMPDPETGEPHYPERNWEKGIPIHSMVDSAFRHLAKYTMGMTDEDHLCAAATNLLMAMWTEDNLPNMQDIPAIHKKYTSDHDELGIERKKAKYLTCSSYTIVNGEPMCYGIKFSESTECGGNPAKCCFYPEKREKYAESG